MSVMVLNPKIPYKGDLPQRTWYQYRIQINGRSPKNAVEFRIKYMLKLPITLIEALVLSFSAEVNCGSANEGTSWIPNDCGGCIQLKPEETFEIIILRDQKEHLISVNNGPYTSFYHESSFPFAVSSFKCTSFHIQGHAKIIESICFQSLDAPIESYVPRESLKSLGSSSRQSEATNPSQELRVTSITKIPVPPSTSLNSTESLTTTVADTLRDLNSIQLVAGLLIATGGIALAIHAYNDTRKQRQRDQSGTSELADGGGFKDLFALGKKLIGDLAGNDIQNTTGLLASIFGKLAGSQKPSSDPMSDAFGSIIGLFSNNQSAGNDASSGINGAIGSILLNFALDSFVKNCLNQDTHSNHSPPSTSTSDPPTEAPPTSDARTKKKKRQKN